MLLVGGCDEGSSEQHAASPAPGKAPSASQPPPTAGEAAVRRMTLREKAGQVIVASWQGTGSPAPLVRRLHLGGVIAFTENVASPRQIREVNRSVSRVVRRRGYPAFLGVDQEGGIVSRVGAPATAFPAFMASGAADDAALTERVARASAAEMRGLGFDVVLAPVADVSAGDGDAVIGSRAAGGRPALVARQVLAAGKGIEEAGVLPVVKHFPGHGDLAVDSHRELPVQRGSMRQLKANDLVPFAAAIRHRVPAIMTGHIDVRAVDKGVPASISRAVTTGLLRREMGYDGLVVTDALDMGGVQSRAPGGRAAVGALRAGADVLLMPPDPREARDRVVQAVRSGALPQARLDEAAAAMIDTMLALRDRPARPARTGSGHGVSLALSRAALTSVAGPCTGRLIPPRVRVEGPSAAVGAFDRSMAARGVTIARDVHKRVKVGTRKVVVGHRRKWVRRKVVDQEGHVTYKRVRKRVAVRKRVPVYKRVTILADAPTVALVGFGGGTPRASDIVVALDRPAVLGRASARVKLATYGETPESIRALADVLMGTRAAPGRLPIDVPGVGRAGC